MHFEEHLSSISSKALRKGNAMSALVSDIICLFSDDIKN